MISEKHRITKLLFPGTAPADKISVGAERQRRYRAMKRWRNAPTEEGSADVRITARSK